MAAAGDITGCRGPERDAYCHSYLVVLARRCRCNRIVFYIAFDVHCLDIAESYLASFFFPTFPGSSIPHLHVVVEFWRLLLQWRPASSGQPQVVREAANVWRALSTPLDRYRQRDHTARMTSSFSRMAVLTHALYVFGRTM